MQRTCSHLVGRQVGEMIRGTPLSVEESRSKNWLTNRLFSHGLELSPEIGKQYAFFC